MTVALPDTARIPGGSLPSVYSEDQNGGFATLANLAAIQAIGASSPFAAKWMIRVAADTGIAYQLQADLTTWTQITIGGGGSGGDLYAANTAALSSLAVATQAARVYLATRRRYLNYDGNSTLTVDNKRVFATANGGSTRWISEGGTSHAYWWRQTAYYIDALNGDDDNTGLASNAPLKTFDELNIRLGTYPLISSPTGTMTIYVAATDPGINDPINFIPILASGITFRFVGTATQSRTGGTISTFTALDRSASQGFTSITVSDSSSWTSDVAKRVRITTAGARQNAIAWVIKGVGSAGKVGSFTKPTDFFQTPVTPQAGDTYDLETLPRVVIGALNFLSASNTTGAFPTISVVDLDIGYGATSGQIQPISGAGIVWNFRGCRLRGPFNLFGGFFFAENCCFSQGFQLKNTYGHMAGGVVGPGSSGVAACVISDGASITFDDDIIFNGTSGIQKYTGGSAIFTRCGIYNSVSSPGISTYGDAIVVGASIGNPAHLVGGGTISVMADSARNAPVLYGDGNAGVFIRLGPASGCTYDQDEVTFYGTGSLGDFFCGNATTNLASIDPTTNGLDSAKAQTFANLITARGSGGFGYVVRNPENMAYFVPND